MAAQVAELTVEQAKKSLQDQATQAPKNGESQFDGILARKAGEPGGYTGPATLPGSGLQLNGTPSVNGAAEATRVKLEQYLQSTAPSSTTSSTATDRSAPVTSKSDSSRLTRSISNIISELEQGQGRLDKLIASGLSGKELSVTEMLSLQASMYKYTQEMELTGKVVEKATNGLKETLKTQV
jgi:hypothetical protein